MCDDAEHREKLVELQEEIDQLRAALRGATDALADLLKEGRFPRAGRSRDSQDALQGWWEDRVAAVQAGYAALARVSHGEWTGRHPGLYIPPPGAVKLD